MVLMMIIMEKKIKKFTLMIKIDLKSWVTEVKKCSESDGLGWAGQAWPGLA